MKDRHIKQSPMLTLPSLFGGSHSPLVNKPSGGGGNVGQQEYTTAGTYTWVCPAGVTSVSVVCIGGGGTGGAYGGSGGSLAYKNNITVSPGTSYTIIVGATNAVAGATPPYNESADDSSAFGTCLLYTSPSPRDS